MAKNMSVLYALLIMFQLLSGSYSNLLWTLTGTGPNTYKACTNGYCWTDALQTYISSPCFMGAGACWGECYKVYCITNITLGTVCPGGKETRLIIPVIPVGPAFDLMLQCGLSNLYGDTANETTLSAYTKSALISPQTKARPYNPRDTNDSCVMDHKFNCQTNPICLQDGFYKSSAAGGFDRGCVQNQATPGTTLPAALAYIGLKSGAC